MDTAMRPSVTTMPSVALVDRVVGSPAEVTTPVELSILTPAGGVGSRE